MSFRRFYLNFLLPTSSADIYHRAPHLLFLDIKYKPQRIAHCYVFMTPQLFEVYAPLIRRTRSWTYLHGIGGRKQIISQHRHIHVIHANKFNKWFVMIWQVVRNRTTKKVNTITLDRYMHNLLNSNLVLLFYS